MKSDRTGWNDSGRDQIRSDRESDCWRVREDCEGMVMYILKEDMREKKSKLSIHHKWQCRTIQYVTLRYTVWDACVTVLERKGMEWRRNGKEKGENCEVNQHRVDLFFNTPIHPFFRCHVCLLIDMAWRTVFLTHMGSSILSSDLLHHTSLHRITWHHIKWHKTHHSELEKSSVLNFSILLVISRYWQCCSIPFRSIPSYSVVLEFSSRL